MCVAFKERHDKLLARLQALPGVTCLPSDGTFYSFPDFSAAIAALDGVEDDLQFAEYLINKAGVALVPGSAFGAPGHARISFATSQANLGKAMDRISAVLPRA
jgi:aspartate aminotransferase